MKKTITNLLCNLILLSGLQAQSIMVDNNTRYQTIDGFGFFGAHQFWWGNPAAFWNQEWAEMMISDLGLTIWRNEIYPPSTPQRNQPVDFAKQKPVISGLKSVADAHGVDLKYILTVWSPPAHMKWGATFAWAGDNNAKRYPLDNIQTNHGGTLNPNLYKEYAEYLINHIQLYKDAGVDVYALSLQNEPAFSQSFNSCTYTTFWYCEMLEKVVPTIKKSFPDIKIFGSEHMLLNEGRDQDWRWFYHNAIKNSSGARNNIDILAVHGYSDGVIPTSGSHLAKMWTNHTQQFANPLNKPVWMTETSGYDDSWEAGISRPGALGLAMDIHAALHYGNIKAWVWWQGSENPHTTNINQYVLMAGTTVGKKYYASKHFYRFIRPGAERVRAISPYEDVFVTAYKQPEKNTQTLVIINSSSVSKEVLIEGSGLPPSFDIYRTSASENCKNVGIYTTNTNLILPPRSLITLTSDGTLTGMSEKKNINKSSSPEIIIYPNPYREGKLALHFNEMINSEVSITFHSVSGVLMGKHNAQVNDGKLDLLPELNRGIYLMSIEENGRNISKLFFVQ